MTVQDGRDESRDQIASKRRPGRVLQMRLSLMPHRNPGITTVGYGKDNRGSENKWMIAILAVPANDGGLAADTLRVTVIIEHHICPAVKRRFVKIA